jgi:hypothetical protein
MGNSEPNRKVKKTRRDILLFNIFVFRTIRIHATNVPLPIRNTHHHWLSQHRHEPFQP